MMTCMWIFQIISPMQGLHLQPYQTKYVTFVDFIQSTGKRLF